MQQKMKYYQAYYSVKNVCDVNGATIKTPSKYIERTLILDTFPADWVALLQVHTYKVVYELLDYIELSQEEYYLRKNKKDQGGCS